MTAICNEYCNVCKRKEMHKFYDDLKECFGCGTVEDDLEPEEE